MWNLGHVLCPMSSTMSQVFDIFTTHVIMRVYVILLNLSKSKLSMLPFQI